MTNNSSQPVQHLNSSAMATPSHVTTSEVKGWCATFAAEAVVVSIGNLFIITVFAKTRELRNRHFFLINLAVADFLVGAFAEPLFVYILGGYYDLWNFKHKDILFPVSMFLDMFSGISSIAFLAAIALERLYATLYPAKYRATKYRGYAILTFLLWVISASIPSIRIYLGNDYTSSLYVWMPFVCLLLLIIGSAYIVIWVKVLFFTSKRLNRGRERRLNVTVTILTLASLSAWLPFIIVNTVNMFRPVSIVAVYSTKVLHYGNSLVNPFLFALKMPKFRQAAKNIFCNTRRNAGGNRESQKRRDISTNNMIKSCESSSTQSIRRNLEIKCTAI
ncbi:hypothetical protein OS493_003163 [Desmophyllum pertusum]|uniref:G-protein coupled receptors family 1 profile domain-containing protein n=1 Tax=Desmophyllum pertusum TaxID=174260 RepID=A0A9X0CIG1_9CNID|nr:hypothetical protein OS493_003163 [Desmophyllum pertusum]